VLHVPEQVTASRGVHKVKDICHIDRRITASMTAPSALGFIDPTDERGDDRGERLL
jgi:hypothetical protein